MVKYISNLIDEIRNLIAGMTANAEKWTNQDIAVADLEGSIQQLDAQAAKIGAAEKALQKEREVGRNLAESISAKKNHAEKLAIGIHAEETVKLADYGLSVRKNGSSKPVPGKAIIVSIVDDVDGEGFVITWNRLVDADHYEIEKGVAANSSDLVLTPPYTFLKTTTKIVLTDDNVLKGQRYFYRVRGVNATGAGEWSEPVNRVQ